MAAAVDTAVTAVTPVTATSPTVSVQASAHPSSQEVVDQVENLAVPPPPSILRKTVSESKLWPISRIKRITSFSSVALGARGARGARTRRVSSARVSEEKDLYDAEIERFSSELDSYILRTQKQAQAEQTSAASAASETSIKSIKSIKNEENQTDLLKIVVLYNGQSGGGKSARFCQQLSRYNIETFDMIELARSDTKNNTNKSHDLDQSNIQKFQNNINNMQDMQDTQKNKSQDTNTTNNTKESKESKETNNTTNETIETRVSTVSKVTNNTNNTNTSTNVEAPPQQGTGFESASKDETLNDSDITLKTSNNVDNNNLKLTLGTILHKYENKCVVAICGGDGAYSWAINFLIDECLECAKNSLHVPHIAFPHVCCIPAGTGNDLSRCLGWGYQQVTGKQGLECVEYLADIELCYHVLRRFDELDRWSVNIEFVEELEKIRNNNNKNNNNKNNNNHTESKMNDIDMQNNENNIENNDEMEYKKIFKQKQYQYDPPLPTSFISYLSFGYDAMVAYTYEQERRQYRSRFSSQAKNGLMYLKHGIGEFFVQSEPLNDKLKLFVDEKEVDLISSCRSLKLMNINAAIGGIFFWGSKKSARGELQHWTRPKLNDSKLEVMATRGVHSMIAHRVNVSHAHRIAQSCNVRIEVLKPPLALQIDGEAWLVEEKLNLNVKLKDRVPIIVGCREGGPLGVENKFENEKKKTMYQHARKNCLGRLVAAKMKQFESNEKSDVVVVGDVADVEDVEEEVQQNGNE